LILSEGDFQFMREPTQATPKNFVSALLAELGDPAAENGNIGSQTNRFRKFLKELKRELITPSSVYVSA
jgi:hypothetical protein